MTRTFSRFRALRNRSWASLKDCVGDAIWVDGDLKRLEREADEQLKRLLGPDDMPPKLDGAKLKALVELLRDVTKTEFDRETNLNTRAAAVAGVAALIVTASGAIGKSIFEGTVLGGKMKFASAVLFLVGLVALVAAMFMVVVVVLRPRQAPTRRIFFTDTLVGLWTAEGRSTILDAEPDQLNLLLVDRSLRTLAYWSVRNRQKARWLRRSWMFLALGILVTGVAGVLVVSTVLGYSLATVCGIVAAGLGVIWLVLRFDPIHASRKPLKGFDDEEKERLKELGDIAEALRGSSSEKTRSTNA